MLVEGAGLSQGAAEVEAKQIHEDNLSKLSSMGEEEILAEQRKLLEMLGEYPMFIILECLKKFNTSLLGSALTAYWCCYLLLFDSNHGLLKGPGYSLRYRACRKVSNNDNIVIWIMLSRFKSPKKLKKLKRKSWCYCVQPAFSQVP